MLQFCKVLCSDNESEPKPIETGDPKQPSLKPNEEQSKDARGYMKKLRKVTGWKLEGDQYVSDDDQIRELLAYYEAKDLDIKIDGSGTKDVFTLEKVLPGDDVACIKRN